MKKILQATVFSLLIMSSAFAVNKAPAIAITKATFSPVAWHATMGNGGFQLQNQTTKIQYVQVNIEHGEILIYTTNSEGLGNCHKNLDAQKGISAVVCELAPNDILNADVDFSNPVEANGTYQVEMG